MAQWEEASIYKCELALSATSVTLSVTVLEADDARKLRALENTAERATGTASAVRRIDMVGDSVGMSSE